MDHEVFISYSSANIQTAHAICHALESNRIKCWMAPRDIRPGAEYGDIIEEAIVTCKVFLIVFSETSQISRWVRSELNIGFSSNKPIIPFRIDPTDLKGSMKLMLNDKHWLNAILIRKRSLVSWLRSYLMCCNIRLWIQFHLPAFNRLRMSLLQTVVMPVRRGYSENCSISCSLSGE